MKKYIHIFLCLMILATGCGKKQKNTMNKNATIPKKTQKSKAYNKSSLHENLEAFALDDDTLHKFAHDTTTPDQKNKAIIKADEMLEWQNAVVDQSKEDFKKIYFEFDKYKITKEQEAALHADIQHAKKMIKLGKIIVIEGHACDSAGSAVYNMTLSEKRAQYIASKFTDADIDKAHIKIAARGQEMPEVKGGNRHQQAVNRRVEVYAIDAK